MAISLAPERPPALASAREAGSVKVLWTEGMFLTPHHLQAHEQGQEALLHGRLGALPVPSWGVRSLDLDESALVAGRVRVRSLEAVLPDGTWVVLGPEDPPVERTLPDGAGTAGIHLALPALHERAVNVANDGDPTAASARFRVRELEVHDTNGEAEPRTILAARLAPVLQLDRDPSDGFVRLKLAEVARDGAGAWSFSDRYVPRMLRAAGSSVLRRLVDDVVVEVQARRRALADDLGSVQATEITSRNVFQFWQLHALNAAIGRIEHVIGLEEAPPERWFEALRVLAAELTTFEPGRQPSDLPLYAPGDAWGSFSRLATAIRELLGQQAPSDFVAIELVLDQGVWKGAIPADPRLAKASFYLVVGGSGAEVPLTEDARRAIKIAAPDEIDRLVRMRLDGVSLAELREAPPGVPKRRDARFLGLRASGLVWRRIAETGAVAVHVPTAIPATRVELVAVP